MLCVQVITRRARPTREFFCPCPGRAVGRAFFLPKGVPEASTNNLQFFVQVFLAVLRVLRYTVVVFWSMGSEMADVSVERI